MQSMYISSVKYAIKTISTYNTKLAQYINSKMEESELLKIENHVRTIVKQLITPTIRRSKQNQKLIEALENNRTEHSYKLEDLALAVKGLNRKSEVLDEYSKKLAEFDTSLRIFNTKSAQERERMQAEIDALSLNVQNHDENLEVLQSQKNIINEDISRCNQAIINSKTYIDGKIQAFKEDVRERLLGLEKEANSTKGKLKYLKDKIGKVAQTFAELEIISRRADANSESSRQGLNLLAKSVKSSNIEFTHNLEGLREMTLRFDQRARQQSNALNKFIEDELPIRQFLGCVDILYASSEEVSYKKSLAKHESGVYSEWDDSELPGPLVTILESAKDRMQITLDLPSSSEEDQSQNSEDFEAVQEEDEEGSEYRSGQEIELQQEAAKFQDVQFQQAQDLEEVVEEGAIDDQIQEADDWEQGQSEGKSVKSGLDRESGSLDLQSEEVSKEPQIKQKESQEPIIETKAEIQDLSGGVDDPSEAVGMQKLEQTIQLQEERNLQVKSLGLKQEHTEQAPSKLLPEEDSTKQIQKESSLKAGQNQIPVQEPARKTEAQIEQVSEPDQPPRNAELRNNEIKDQTLSIGQASISEEEKVLVHYKQEIETQQANTQNILLEPKEVVSQQPIETDIIQSSVQKQQPQIRKEEISKPIQELSVQNKHQPQIQNNAPKQEKKPNDRPLQQTQPQKEQKPINAQMLTQPKSDPHAIPVSASAQKSQSVPAPQAKTQPSAPQQVVPSQSPKMPTKTRIIPTQDSSKPAPKPQPKDSPGRKPARQISRAASQLPVKRSPKKQSGGGKAKNLSKMENKLTKMITDMKRSLQEMQNLARRHDMKLVQHTIKISERESTADKHGESLSIHESRLDQQASSHLLDIQNTNETLELFKQELADTLLFMDLKYDEFKADTRDLTKSLSVLIKQAIYECNEAIIQRRRDHSDNTTEFKRFKSSQLKLMGDQKSLGGQLTAFKRVLDGLIEYARITNTLQGQDEEDRDSIALMGVADKKHSRARSTLANSLKQKPVLTLDKQCLSCNGQTGSVMGAFKMACLAYSPSKVYFGSDYFDRKDLLGVQRRLIDDIWDEPLQRSQIESKHSISEVMPMIPKMNGEVDLPPISSRNSKQQLRQYQS